jgi:putative transposase
MTTPLVLDALEMAIWARRKQGITDLTGLVHHTDAGSQYTSIAFTARLLEAGVDPSVGSVGDASTTPWRSPRSGSTRAN